MTETNGFRRVAIVAEIHAERDRQDAQWGGVEHDDCHSSSDWMDFIDHQLDRWHEEGEARVRLIRIAALAIAGIESIDRREPTTPATGEGQ